MFHIQKLQEKLLDAVENKKYVLFEEINQEVVEFKQNLDSSTMYSNFCTFMYAYYFNEKLKYPDIASYHCEDPSVVEHFREITEQVHIQLAEAKETEISKITESYEDKLAEANKERDDTKMQLEQKSAELEELKQTWSMKESNLEEKINSLKSEFKQSLEENGKKVAKLLDTIESKDTNIRSLIQDNTNEKLANFEASETFKAQIKDLEESCETLKKQLKNKEKSLEKKNKKASEDLNTIRSLEAQIADKGN